MEEMWNSNFSTVFCKQQPPPTLGKVWSPWRTLQFQQTNPHQLQPFVYSSGQHPPMPNHPSFNITCGFKSYQKNNQVPHHSINQKTCPVPFTFVQGPSIFFPSRQTTQASLQFPNFVFLEIKSKLLLSQTQTQRHDTFTWLKIPGQQQH